MKLYVVERVNCRIEDLVSANERDDDDEVEESVLQRLGRNGKKGPLEMLGVPVAIITRERATRSNAGSDE